MKLDTTNIENFDKLSAEEKVNALLSLDLPDEPDLSKLVSKELFDKTSSELANVKKQLKASISEEEQKRLEQEQKDKEREELINQLLREKAEANYTSKLIELGIESNDAAKQAKGLPDGITDEFFSGLAKLKSDIEKSIRAEITRSTPQIMSNGNGGNHALKTKEEIMNIRDSIERQQAIEDNIDLFQ